MNKIILYIIVPTILCISCSSQKIKNKNFTEQFFINQNVYKTLQKYAQNNTVNIIDPDHNITDKSLLFNNNDLTINISSERNNEYDFYVKKVIVDENLAFIVLWYKDTTTALCFYPIKSKHNPSQWIIEEITTRSIK